MKAIILAAGKGERLKGVIDNIPKPMIKVSGKAILEHNIEWLAGFGVRDIYINLHYLPDIIRGYFGNGDRWNIRITYSYEHQILGTAGAVRKIADDYWYNNEEAFVIVYGDNLLSDFDLEQIVNFHKTKKGIGTICLYYKDDVSQGGIAVMDKKNRIIKFIEKPDPDQVISNLVNTGIYIFEPGILEYIPKNCPYDFGKDLFHKVIKSDENLYGLVQNANLIAIDTPELLKKTIAKKV